VIAAGKVTLEKEISDFVLARKTRIAKNNLEFSRKIKWHRCKNK
jgi:hypothetical protein